jgi:hypothetical protein
VTVKIEQRPQERTLFAACTLPYDAEKDTTDIVQAITQFAATMNGLFFVVGDYRQIDLSFGDMVIGMGSLRQLPGAGQVQIVAIGSGEIMKLAADAASQKQYGQYNVVLVATPEEAFNHVANERKRLGV